MYCNTQKGEFFIYKNFSFKEMFNFYLRITIIDEYSFFSVSSSIHLLLDIYFVLIKIPQI